MILNLSTPRAVIFDMDGLLLDSERMMIDIQKRVFEELGLPWREEIALSVVGLSSQATDDAWRKAYGADYPLQAVNDRFVALYEQTIHDGGIAPKPFARELVDRLEGMRVRRAVATSTRRRHAELKLHRAHLFDRMDAIACGDEVIRPKPAPEIYELAASRLGVEPTHCLVLEDSNTGVRAAVAASMQVVMVRDLIPPDPDIRRLGVPCVDSLKDVLVALGG